MNFGELLKTARKNKKMSQDELAKKLGVNRVSISNYENNKNTPTHSNLVKLKEILNVGSSYFDENEIQVKYIPLIGSASCGVPKIFYFDDVEMIPVPAELARDGVYAVRAEGDSMLPKIPENSIIVCDKNMLCENGNIVHYTTIDGESGVKKYLIDDKGIVTLMPLNSDFKPIMCDTNDLVCSRCFKIQMDL